MARVKVDHVVPPEYIFRPPISTSKSVLNRNLLEIQPQDGGSSWSPDSNPLVRFIVSSNSDLLVSDKTYVRLPVTWSVTANTFHAFKLDEGGAHALIKSLEIRSVGRGNVIERIDDYATWYAIQSNLHHSPEQVNTMGALHNDHTEEQPFIYQPTANTIGYNNNTLGDTISGTVAANSDDGVGYYTSTVTNAANAHLQLQVGDVLRFECANGANAETAVTGLVSAIVNDTSYDILTTTQITAAIEVAINEVRLLGHHGRRNPRYIRSDAEPMVYNLKLFSGLLMSNPRIPLYLMKGGIEIIIELERAKRSCYVNSGDGYRSGGNVNNISYTVSNARLMAMMETPHASVIEEHMQAWRKPEGIVLAYPAVRLRRITRSSLSGSDSLSMHFGVRSARKVYCIVQPVSIADGDGDTAAINPSKSLFLRTFINKYQFRIGSHEYPNRDIEDYYKESQLGSFFTEALLQTCHDSGSKALRFPLEDFTSNANFFVKTGNDYTSRIDARKFIICVSLERYQSALGQLTGADLSVVPLQLDLERNGAYELIYLTGGNVGTNYNGESFVYKFFVEHDQYLHLSSVQTNISN